MVGTGVHGFTAHNQEVIEHGGAPLTFGTYLVSGDFWSATFENWESEFLQMGVYVLLTVWLRQKGSAESRSMQQDETDDQRAPYDGHHQSDSRSCLAYWLYSNSLSIAFLLLFLTSFTGHLLGSWRKSIADDLMHHQPPQTLGAYAIDPSFWFESFQSWQSEFLAVFSLIVLSIYLRQKDSHQSKAVEAPNDQTGT